VTGFVKHESKVTGAQWVQTLTFGFIEMPEATLNQSTQVSTDLGVPVTPQGLEERMTDAAVRFLRSLLSKSLKLSCQVYPAGTGATLWLHPSDCRAGRAFDLKIGSTESLYPEAIMPLQARPSYTAPKENGHMRPKAIEPLKRLAHRAGS